MFYLRYHGYRWYFPLMALARYRNLRLGNTYRVGIRILARNNIATNSGSPLSLRVPHRPLADPPWMKPAFTVMAGLVPAIGRGTLPLRMAGTMPGHDGRG